MNIIEKSTDELMNELRHTSPSGLKEYLRQNLPPCELTFTAYIDSLLEQKRLKRQDVILRANLSQKYGYKLLTGEAHTSDRNKILRICFSMQMSVQEAQRALKLYGMNELYPKVRRDVVLIVALGHRVFDIDRVSELLLAEGLEPLYDAGLE